MPKKTKANLESELKKAKRILKNITNCFERDNLTAGYNKLVLNGEASNELDEQLDEARGFLKLENK